MLALFVPFSFCSCYTSCFRRKKLTHLWVFHLHKQYILSNTNHANLPHVTSMLLSHDYTSSFIILSLHYIYCVLMHTCTDPEHACRGQRTIFSAILVPETLISKLWGQHVYSLSHHTGQLRYVSLLEHWFPSCLNNFPDIIRNIKCKGRLPLLGRAWARSLNIKKLTVSQLR